jgi:hypothetical protein
MMKHLDNIICACLAIVWIAVYFGVGGGTKGIVVLTAMIMAMIGGAMLGIEKKKKPYRMTEAELLRIIDGLDQTGGYLVKPNELKHIIEEKINEERGTTFEWESWCTWRAGFGNSSKSTCIYQMMCYGRVTQGETP